ncbi:ribose 5-phosphate isomerase B [Christensenellaceae bacterium OttesenSCG-928-M15]|nr:ribose 5-phosphate isomerase B [Christensenellaceae bacterium OttesenSCG-928-M15]
MKIAIGCDHAAYAYKTKLIGFLEEKGHTVTDFGCDSEQSVDYADYALPVANAVVNGDCERGILICYTGIGMSIAANKVKGVRCALCGDPLSARLTRQHNDTNVLALGAGVIGLPMAEEIVSVWLEETFQGGRHKRRIDKIMEIEAR